MWRSDYELRLNDIDGLGHLTATWYLGLLEETRAAWLIKSLGVGYPSCVLRTQHIEYLHEITRADGTVTVSLAVKHLGTSSVRLAEEISAGGTVRARSDAVLVMWDKRTRAARPMTDEERTVLGSFVPSGARPSAFSEQGSS